MIAGLPARCRRQVRLPFASTYVEGAPAQNLSARRILADSASGSLVRANQDSVLVSRLGVLSGKALGKRVEALDSFILDVVKVHEVVISWIDL